ncbi:MAG: hypothetical protein AVDCRST_MAG34-1636 [uncultured Nocardioidaceae bacterium]|uniref:Lipoprotein n=1 Tax=uncultured Nocardioidaceae bacterium TaxID=253824 RepID=A0A6J4M3T7_9ACTN|nr:MAG: hypothetical protein AVDCRST_MAG34-1636 [uncultured Nocardioidaceae bacterium]
MRLVLRPLVPVVSVCALAVPLAACGGSEAGDRGATTVAAGAAEPAADTGASTLSPSAFVDRVRSGIGDSGSAHAVLRVTGAMAADGEGDVEYGPGGPEGRFTLSVPAMGTGEITALLVDHTLYVAVPGMTQPGQYFKVDKELLAGLGGPGHAKGMDDHHSMSPEVVLAAIEAGIKKVETLGAETVGGEPVEHFRLTLDPQGAAEALGLADKLDAVTKESGESGVPDSLVADVWLDAEDRLRQFDIEVEGATVHLELSKWGEPVDVEAPAAKDLVPAPFR